MKKFLRSKWTIIIAAILVVAAAGTVFALNYDNWVKSENGIFSGKLNWFGNDDKTEEKGKEEDKTTSEQIFWNVDRALYAYQGDGISSSRPMDKEDSYYHVKFAAVNQAGREVTRRVKDKKVVNKIDSLYCMSLVTDEKGIIVDVKPIEDVGYKFLYKRVYVSNSVNNCAKVTVDTSSSFNGISRELDLSDPSIVKYDVCGATGNIGNTLQGDLKECDTLYILGDKSDKVKYVFLTAREEPNLLYWNVNRMWSSSMGISTRKPGPDGFYEILLAVDGKQVTYKTDSSSIVKNIDSAAGKCFGLEVDEEKGIITSFKSATKASGGKVFASWYHVTSLVTDENGRTVMTCEKSDKTVSATLSRNCKIYNVTSVKDSVCGEVTDVRVGDVVQCYTNKRGDVGYIYVVANRTVNSDMYWNVKRMYNSDKKMTTRVPDAQGRYVFRLGAASTGQIAEYWTKDVELANKIDASEGRCIGVKLNGNEIVGYYSATNVSGKGVAFSWYTVVSIDGDKLTAQKGKNESTRQTMTIDPSCLVCNTHNTFCRDTLDVGDVIQSYKNYFGRINYIMIVTKVTKPYKIAYCPHCDQVVSWYGYTGGTPANNVDGKHYILINDVINGSQYNVGSTSNTTGKYTPMENILDLNGHVYKASARAIAIQIGCKLTLLDSVGGGVVTTASTAPKVQGVGVWVRNYAEFDFLGGTIDMTGVKNVAYSGTSLACETHSVIKMYDGARIINGTTYKGFRNSKDEEAQEYNGGTGGNVYIQSDCEFTMYGGEISGGLSTSDISGVSAGGANVYINSKAMFTMLGGVIKNGTSYGTGGNITNSGTFNLFGGTITGGKALLVGSNSGAHGGNIYDTGKFNILGGTISDGYADKFGGNISANSSGSKLTMSGGAVTGGKSGTVSDKYPHSGSIYLSNNDNVSFTLTGGSIKGLSTVKGEYEGGGLYVSTGNVSVSGKVDISGADVNLRLPSGNKLTVGELDSESTIGLTVAGGGIFAQNAKDYIACFTPDDSEKYEIVVRNNYDLCMNLIGSHSHSVAEGCTCAAVSTDVRNDFISYMPLTQKIVDASSFTTSEGETVSKTAGALPASYSWYLTEDVDVTAQNSKVTTTAFNLCLNGHNITSSADKRIFCINASTTSFPKYNITDCVGGGVISRPKSSSSTQGRLLWMNGSSKARVSIYGGIFDARNQTTTNANGGSAFYLAMTADPTETANVLNMYGGKILGGDDTKTDTGTAVAIVSKSQFNFYGGEIVGLEGATSPNSVLLSSSNAKFKLAGGKFINGHLGVKSGTVEIVGKGSEFDSKSAVRLMSAHTSAVLTLNELDSAASIPILMDNPGVFIENASEYKLNFVSFDPLYEIIADVNNLKLSLIS